MIQLPEVFRVKKMFHTNTNVVLINTNFGERQAQMRNESVDFMRNEACSDKERAMYRTQHKRRLKRSREETSDPPVAELRKYFRMLNNCETSEKAFSILDSLKNSGIKIHMMFFTKMMKICAKLRLVDKCSQVLDEIDSLGLTPDLLVFSAALAVGHKARDLPSTLVIWQRMVDAGIEPDQMCYSTMIATCAELPRKERTHAFPKVRWRLAETFFAEMRQRGIPADHITYGVLLNVYAKAGLSQRAEEVFNDMKRITGILPDSFIYNSLITAFQSDHPERAIKYFTEAKEAGLANMPVYTTAMGCFQNMGEYQEVLKLWSEMRVLGFRKSDVSLSIYFRAMARVGSTGELMEAMEREETFANQLVLCNTIHELYYGSHVDTAVQLFAKGFALGVLPVFSKKNHSEFDFHSHFSGVVCSAIRYFLAERVKENNDKELSLIVGRGMHSGTKSHATLGIAVRKLLDELGLRYEERSNGGSLVITNVELRRYISSSCG